MIIAAHRGASKAERENTVAAFQRARAMGADMVELDVRRCADGVLIVHHDASIAGLGPIVAMNRDALPSYVPDLSTALDACRGMDVNVEIKSDPDEPDYDADQWLARRVTELLLSRTEAARMLVSSFDFDTIAVVRSVAPLLRTGFLCTRPRPDAATLISRVAEAGHEALHPLHLAVNRALVEAAHAAGLRVNTWTVDDPDRIRELASWGVDAVITNVPDVARAALG